MADQGGGTASMRDYRKGNWTLTETMILIEAKKMDDERRLKRNSDSEARGKPTELRWKWVEDYCWRKGCFRSQNQCNDKWDNLMRDYKKVRDYERKLAEKGEANGPLAYRKLEKNERKERNLPSNMIISVYEALIGAVERRAPRGQTPLQGSSSNPNYPSVAVALPQQRPLPPHPPPLPPSSTPQRLQQGTGYTDQNSSLIQRWTCPDSDNTSGYSDSPAKRRRRGSEETGAGEGSQWQEIGNVISRSASIIADAIHASDEREERRHRDLVSVHERRLRMEEAKAELNKQGINGLIESINNLANSIRGLASHTPPNH